MSSTNEGNNGVGHPSLTVNKASNQMQFNLTQPVQLQQQNNEGSIRQQNLSNKTNTSSTGAGGFGGTQPSLQKILRSLSKQNNGVGGGATLSSALHQSLSANTQQQQTANANANAGGSQSKNMSAVSQQRKSSSHKGRRVDHNLNPQIPSSNKSQQSGANINNTKGQGTSSSLITNSTNNNEQPTSATSKGRSLLKHSINNETSSKVPTRGSRNPRNMEGGAAPSQSNTGPVVANSSLSGMHIGPTMGTESGGGGTIQISTSQKQMRPLSGKRMQQRSSADSNQQSKISSQHQNGNLIRKYITQSSSGGNSIPVTNMASSQNDSRFSQKSNKLSSMLHTEPYQQLPIQSMAGNGNQVLHTEANISNNNNSQHGANTKYFSQRIQNQLRNNKGQQGNNEEKGGSSVATINGRTQKEELLRAFINPQNSGQHQQEETSSKSATRQSNAFAGQATEGNSSDETKNSKFKQQKVTSSRSQGKHSSGVVTNTTALSAEIGGFQGSSLEKIVAKASKIKQGASAFSNTNGDEKSATATKNTMPQAANSFRAKLLRSQENNNSKETSSSIGSGQQTNSQKQLQKQLGIEAASESPHTIQKALNTLKKSLNKQQLLSNQQQQQQEENQADNINNSSSESSVSPTKKQGGMSLAAKKAAEEAKKKELEKNLGPDDIVEYRSMKMTVSQREEYMEMEEEQIVKFRQNYYPAKFASKKNGIVVTYAANTHQGMVRNYNEDRVSIILNIIKPKFKQIDFWPRCSFFAIYDGHGGAQCADFLRDQLHQLIVRDPSFPQDPVKAMQNGFEQAEKSFLSYAHEESDIQAGNVQRSGTCAIVILIIGEIAYIANVGDSRAFMSIDNGTKIVPLSIDHKPENEQETERIEANGGRVYQNQSYIPDPTPDNESGTQTLIGPHRVFPGRLSVSRTIGDIEAKDVRYGGNPDVVIAIPEIRAFKIKENYDFIIIGCDGVFEKMNNQDCMDQVWESSLQPENLKSPLSIHARCGSAVDACLNECVNQKTLDNITCVIVGFANYEKLIERARTTGGRNDKIRDNQTDVEELELDWEAEMLQLDDNDSSNIFNKLMKPLEPVEEEMLENSELETPVSEVVDVTRKNRNSKHNNTNSNPYNDCPESLNSHQSSVSDRYASSSRRQSQLLEAQDTQNLLDHDLLNSQPTISLTNSRKTSQKRLAPTSEQQPVNSEYNPAILTDSRNPTNLSKVSKSQNNNNLLSNTTADSGIQQKTAISQKEYKIRQTSASPVRGVQRQNSGNNIRKQQDLTASNANNIKTNLANPTMSVAHQQYQTAQPFSQGKNIAIPTYTNTQQLLVNSDQVQSKASRTPINPNKNGRNLIDVKQQQSSQERPKQPLSNNAHQSLLGKSNSQRPVTPKRIHAVNNNFIRGQQLDSSQHLTTLNQIDKNRQHSSSNVRDRDSNASTSDLANIGQHSLNNNNNNNANLNTGKASSKSQGRRKEELKHLQQNEDLITGKFTKKMVANWVGNNNTQAAVQGVGTNSNSLMMVNSNQISGTSGGGMPPSKHKSISTISKSYITNTVPQKSSQNNSNSSKMRTQRVSETIHNLINQTHQAPPTSSGNNELMKDHQLAEFQSQYNSFSGHQPTQQALKQQSLLTEHVGKSNSNPPRQRKKSSGKMSNKTTQRTVNLLQDSAHNPQGIGTTTTVQSVYQTQIPLVQQHQTQQQIKNQRSSASRNKPSYLQASVGAPVMSNSAGNAMASNLITSSLQGPNHTTGANITLNFNQINLTTTGSNRLHQQQHHNVPIQAQMLNKNSQNHIQGHQQQATSQSTKQQQQQATTRYSNTINLSGIKQLSTNVLKQSQHHPNMVVKRLRENQ